MDLLLKYQIALKIYYKNNVKKLSNLEIEKLKLNLLKEKLTVLRRHEKKI
ncbi:unnamed protein product [marine sediment metagenome]|uniref:Uncharacterized protein n=1 Tax=marine sediment metagenome TaxID=412755 RepID=X1CFP6_9ZZZZ